MAPPLSTEDAKAAATVAIFNITFDVSFHEKLCVMLQKCSPSRMSTANKGRSEQLGADVPQGARRGAQAREWRPRWVLSEVDVFTRP